jgi:hypothetical protein
MFIGIKQLILYDSSALKVNSHQTLIERDFKIDVPETRVHCTRSRSSAFFRIIETACCAERALSHAATRQTAVEDFRSWASSDSHRVADEIEVWSLSQRSVVVSFLEVEYLIENLCAPSVATRLHLVINTYLCVIEHGVCKLRVKFDGWG